MSSNIRLKKICQYCRQPFIAQTTVTKYCSLACAQRNYKKRLKESKISKAILETDNQVLNCYALGPSEKRGKPSQNRLHQDWINIGDVSELMGIAERTLYRLIKDQAFPKLKIGRRLLFSKQQVLKYFISKSERPCGEN